MPGFILRKSGGLHLDYKPLWTMNIILQPGLGIPEINYVFFFLE